MRVRGAAKVVAQMAMALSALLIVGVLLAAMPGHRAPALQQPDPSVQSTQQRVSGDVRHDTSGMDMSDEKASERHAVHDMNDMVDRSAVTQEMQGHHHASGPHMYITSPRPQTPQDAERAEQIVKELREGIEKYRDYRVALAEGYRIFLPNLPQKEYHFTNYKNGFLEAFTFDAARPTSLLYRKSLSGYELVGAMYTMPKIASEDQLDSRIPLSVASWHLHTNLCMPPRPGSSGPRDQMRTADWTKFGLQGSISTQEACDTAGGRFRPVIFGWMVHVYPYHDSIAEVFAH